MAVAPWDQDCSGRFQGAGALGKPLHLETLTAGCSQNLEGSSDMMKMLHRAFKQQKNSLFGDTSREATLHFTCPSHLHVMFLCFCIPEGSSDTGKGFSSFLKSESDIKESERLVGSRCPGLFISLISWILTARGREPVSCATCSSVNAQFLKMEVNLVMLLLSFARTVLLLLSCSVFPY